MRTLTPIYGRGEKIADRCVHYAGLVAAVLGSVVLIVAAAERERTLTIVSVGIYGAGLLGMIGASALYNLAEPSRRKEWFRRLDHAAIFLMIAVFVWLAAIAGIALKLLYPRRLEGLSIVLYLAIGWAILVGLRPLLAAVPLPAIILIGVGGLLYSFGLVFHLWHRLPYHNAAWHACVLGAAACHWVAVLNGVVRAA